MREKRIPITEEVKIIIFDMYGYQCLLCDERDRRKLQIHHVDRNPSNNEIENLVLTCVGCHAFIYHPEHAEELIEWWEKTFKEDYW